MIEDDEETGESGASTQASSPQSEIVVPRRGKYGHSSGRTATVPHNRITTPNVALQLQRGVSGGDFPRSNSRDDRSSHNPHRHATASPVAPKPGGFSIG